MLAPWLIICERARPCSSSMREPQPDKTGPSFSIVKSRSGSAGKFCAIGNAVTDLVDRLAEIVNGSECAADM